MKIAIDAMGGDNGVKATVKGAVDASKEFNVNIVLVGKTDLIKEELKKYDYDNNKVNIMHAEDIITNEDKPVKAIRRKKQSSMVIGLNLLKEKQVDGFISAGNTGALLSGGLFVVGRIKGIERPALAPALPNEKGFSLLLDAGANVDCKPKHLQQFSIMGSIYSQKVLGVDKPKVGLVNIGVEKEKGNELTKKAYEVLESSNINFYGNLEARDVLKGYVDILICDGFVGNIILKVTEGVVSTIFKTLKSEFTKNLLTKIGALILKPGLKNFKNKLDYSEVGGAPLLGVKGAVIKAHGSSNSKAIKNAVRQAKLFIDNDVISKIESEISIIDSNH